MSVTIGRMILSLAAVSNSISPYFFDFNESHVYNPNWPPHARFHNGQTMSMGLVLGLATLYYTWRPATWKVATTARIRDSTFTAMVIGSMYWVTGLSAGLYPGALFLDPDLVGTKYDASLFGLPIQFPIFTTHLVAMWIGYGLVNMGLGGGPKEE